MHTVIFEEVVDRIVTRDPRYAREAYHFVREALDHTQKRVHREVRGRKESGGSEVQETTDPKTSRREPGGRKSRQDRHVTGRQLLDGIREYGLLAFGPMTLFLLQEWGVRRCEDFGEIVFNLVEHGNGMFGKTDQDSRDDFKGGYDFTEAFQHPFLPSWKPVRDPAAAGPS